MSWNDLKDYLHPKVFEFVVKKWKSPTPIQLRGIPPIYKGINTIISAPTGMGKTETALLPVFSHLLEENKNRILAIYI